MPVVNRIAEFADDMQAWRRHLHAHPEIALDCGETAGFVVERLRDFGVDEIHEGWAETGVVAIIEGQGPGPGRTIGLRADMDALPMQEHTGLEYASTVAGRMHACGHDGHTTMLLGAARYLAETRRFSGRVALIFQPAEEVIGGARIMVDEGLLERFDISELYALHNLPGHPEGSFTTAAGPVLAAVDVFDVHVQGQGGHVARPPETRDPLIAAAAMVPALQTVVTRSADPLQALVVAVTQIHAGSADNIVPDTAYLQGTVRVFDSETRDLAERLIDEIVAGVAAAHGVTARIDYDRGYPPTVNDAGALDKAVAVAREVAGAARVVTDRTPEMGAEDFAYFLERRPGAYLFLGQGDGAGLHHPAYDFNDAIAPVGASWFARLVETLQPL